MDHETVLNSILGNSCLSDFYANYRLFYITTHCKVFYVIAELNDGGGAITYTLHEYKAFDDFDEVGQKAFLADKWERMKHEMMMVVGM